MGTWPDASQRLRLQPYVAGLLTGAVLGVGLLFVLRDDRGGGRQEEPPPAATAPTPNTQTLLRQSRTNAIVTAVEMTRRSVVTIRAAGPIAVSNPLFDLFRFPAQRQRLVPGQWVGSGFLVDRQGHVVTTEHVVRSAQDVVVSLAEGTSTRAVILGTSKRFDLALLRVDLSPHDAVVPALLGDSDDLMVGEWAIAIGSPFGDDLDPQPSVSVGVISAVNRDLLPQTEDVGDWPYFKLLQTDAAINRGNSGGPLVNTNGEVIGVNMALSGITAMGTNVGVNFSIPINTVKWVLEELRLYGEVRTPWVGWLLEEAVPAQLRARIGLSEEEGVLQVTQVEPGSPAAVAGIGAGDVIYLINGQEPYSRRRADRILFETRVGDSIHVQLFKQDGQVLDAVLEVLEHPKMQAERLQRRARAAG